MSTPDLPLERLLEHLHDLDHKCGEPRPARSVLIEPDGREHELASASSTLERDPFCWDACNKRALSI